MDISLPGAGAVATVPTSHVRAAQGHRQLGRGVRAGRRPVCPSGKSPTRHGCRLGGRAPSAPV